MHTETNLDSFILRFVQETEPGEEQRRACVQAAPTMRHTWRRGSIRHVQSNQERHFTHWDDVLNFISEFVNLWEDKTDA